MQRSVHIMILGHVQGVSYRDWLQQSATRLGIDGWVRNRRDGSVEAVLCGEIHKVEHLLAQCYEGSPLAEVNEITVLSEGMTVERGFHVLASV